MCRVAWFKSLSLLSQLAQRKGRALPPDEVAKFEQFGFIVSSMQLGEGDSASDELSEPQSVSCDSASVAEVLSSTMRDAFDDHVRCIRWTVCDGLAMSRVAMSLTFPF